MGYVGWVWSAQDTRLGWDCEGGREGEGEGGTEGWEEGRTVPFVL